jgi:hypothetical protein
MDKDLLFLMRLGGKNLEAYSPLVQDQEQFWVAVRVAGIAKRY